MATPWPGLIGFHAGCGLFLLAAFWQLAGRLPTSARVLVLAAALLSLGLTTATGLTLTAAAIAPRCLQLAMAASTLIGA